MPSPFGSKIIHNSGIVVPRGGVFANVVGGGAPAGHPAVGTGGTWFDVETAAIYADDGLTTPIARTEGEDWETLIPNEIHATVTRFRDLSDVSFYSPGTHATPNGKPSVYTTVGGLGQWLGHYRNNSNPVAANVELSGRDFGRVIIAKRLNAATNETVMTIGSNRPINSRSVAGNRVSCYGFVTGFTSVDSDPLWIVGDWVLIAYRWNAGITELEVSINGGPWQSTAAGDAGWSPDNGAIVLGGGVGAVAFDWYFDGDPDTLSGYSDFAEFITALGIYYGVYGVVSNIHWQGNTDSLINWSAGEAANGQTVQYLANSINTFDPASFIRDPFNNGSGTRVDGAFTGHSGLRINSFGSQYPVRDAANSSDVAASEFLSTTTALLYAAGVHNAALSPNDVIWGIQGSTFAIQVKSSDAAGVRFQMVTASTTYEYETALNPGDKWTVVAGLQGGLLTVYINGVLVADEVAVDGPILNLGSGLRLGYTGLDQTTVVCGAGKINGTKPVVKLISDDLEARRAA